MENISCITEHLHITSVNKLSFLLRKNYTFNFLFKYTFQAGKVKYDEYYEIIIPEEINWQLEGLTMDSVQIH